jgi:hypothetical protein
MDKLSEKNEDGTNRLPRNVSAELPFYAAGNSRRAQDIYLVAEARNTHPVLLIGITERTPPVNTKYAHI